MKNIFTIIKWKYSGTRWFGSREYSYKDIIMSFESRKSAIEHIKNEIGAKYSNGYYIKGDNLYTVKQTKLNETGDNSVFPV